jgi:branched-chain amino acid transport system ATP-binding protein
MTVSQSNGREEPALSVRHVTIAFGGVHAVEDLSFDIPAGSIVSLIGPNGAGKTTLLNSISGFVRARGSIRFKQVELLGQPAYRRAGLGIGRTFQNLQLFSAMTLLDNVRTGQYTVVGGNLLLDVLRFPVVAKEREITERSLALLASLGLEPYAQQRADGLPFGVQKLAGVARALAARPELLLLDEPAAGLNHQEASALGELLRNLCRKMGMTVLLVEHNMRLVMRISDRVIVLHQGRKLAEGAPGEVARNPLVVEAYLGSVEDWATAEEVFDELIDRT